VFHEEALYQVYLPLPFTFTALGDSGATFCLRKRQLQEFVLLRMRVGSKVGARIV